MDTNGHGSVYIWVYLWFKDRVQVETTGEGV
jgi:hypothetical protein